MGFALYRKSAASGAWLESLRWFGVNRAAHRWRAVLIPGIVAVPELACSSCAVTDPRLRAFRSQVNSEFGGRAEPAGGRSGEAPAGLPARQQLACCSLAAPSRELTKKSRLVARARAVGGRSHLQRTGVVKFAGLECVRP